MPIPRLRTLVVAVALVSSACSGSSSPASTSEDAAPSTTSPPPTSAAASPTSVAEPTGAAGSDDLQVLGDLGSVELVDPAPSGRHPVLAWHPVDGADRYRVIVLDADGAPYWGWLGSQTAVTFGGAESGQGLVAAVFEPLTWTVTAVGADGRVLAVSDPGVLPGG